jgi:ElaB/YqjD/DUF883 family membrane-anchored ribosome-binding protein
MDTKHVDGLSGVEEVVPKIVQKVESADQKLVAFVRERPLVALATALAVGYLVGRAVSRLG